ncbi:carbon-nitrogen hydrolase family protein [Pseudomonas panipatensis]|uniref:Predicted amidohydrolase n=1 Tax=Pseudomonas panipatensis TaxID=428992 RepID=A0A1G8L161_9PSED|nr:carbon-nitrogen hydrolase family protein [Pseudomonas panipatensis]SDI49484.1 Predicted amidohydrolase [Pseudomonas panipatensis]SMP72769.1 5-aminopentanamidase [Pseudomonas panipatensis]
MRLALYQCPPGPDDRAGNLRRLREAAQRAASQGADLLVCPEMFVSGYNIGAARVAALAEAAGGSTAAAIATIARDNDLGILYGYPESNPDGAPFNSVQLIDRHGERRANYRKTHLYGDLDRSQFSPSDEAAAVFELDGWKIGLLICFDVEFPEAVRSLALAGADLILVPTANMRPYEFVAEVLVPCRAYENQVFLAYANFQGVEGELDYCGLSSVVAPDGQVLARASQAEELLIADLDPERLAMARAGFSYLKLRRPLLYRS